MISKTSFFNKGIYKSTVKRYSWGALLYFIILFVSTGLSIFLNIYRDFSHMPYDYFENYPVILHGAYITVPILLALVVPTVVALLVFRFIHSKKQSVFIHSIPVSRKANYVSSILASFTLMLVPIILNGIILILISMFGYGHYFTVRDCFVWIGYNLIGVFLMFSVAVFAASVTGNSFAMVAINALIHSFLFITVATLSVMAGVFVYGYIDSNILFENIMQRNFAVVVFGFMDKYFREDITALQIVKFVIAAIALYIGSYFLYKKRRLETASDVAGFKCLNHIFKYVVTFLATMFGFAIFAPYIEENAVVFTIIIAIISIIAYVASEMVLKKTVNILYAWKGYVGFAAFFVALVVLFSQTSFFGYETKVPEIAEIEEASLYNYYHREEPFTANEELVKMVIDAHEDFISVIPSTSYERLYNSPYNTRIHIKYNLKNGKTVYRVYPVTYEQRVELMNAFYEYDEYKQMCEEIFVDESKVIGIDIQSYNNGGYREEHEIDDYKELLAVLKEDILNMSYEELYPKELKSEDVLYDVSVNYLFDSGIDENGELRTHRNGIYINITDKYEKTVKWLKDRNYKSAGYTR
ncbi:MAG: hypothetical protein IJN62_04660 [Clostridia bacterium]|nr:hypothetical protein [Clostridia bacterium]